MFISTFNSAFRLGICRLKNSGRQFWMPLMKRWEGEVIEIEASYEQLLKLYSMKIGLSIIIWYVGFN